MNRELQRKMEAAERTLESLGFVYCGGDSWYSPKTVILTKTVRKEVPSDIVKTVGDAISDISNAIDELQDSLNALSDAYDECA